MTIDELIETFRRLEALPEEAAKLVGESLDRITKANIAAGQGPDGASWPEKKGGGKALAKAAAAVQTKTHGTVIRQTLTGYEVYHHYGTKRVPRRQILPDAGSGEVADAFAKAATEAFNKAIK